MSRIRVSDLFARLFEPRNVIVFLISSIAISVLGSGVYGLLVALTGEQPHILVMIVIGAAAVLLLSVIILYGWLRALAARSQGAQTLVPPEQVANPHRGLILAVGLNVDGPELRIIDHHLRGQTLRHCWLIATPEVERSEKFGDLRQHLLEQNVEPHRISVENGHQADLGYSATLQAIREARTVRDALPLIVDITSGQRPTTVGMVLACRDEDMPLEYFAAPRDQSGHPQPHLPSVPVKLEVESL